MTDECTCPSCNPPTVASVRSIDDLLPVLRAAARALAPFGTEIAVTDVLLRSDGDLTFGVRMRLAME